MRHCDTPAEGVHTGKGDTNLESPEASTKLAMLLLSLLAADT